MTRWNEKKISRLRAFSSYDFEFKKIYRCKFESEFIYNRIISMPLMLKEQIKQNEQLKLILKSYNTLVDLMDCV